MKEEKTKICIECGKEFKTSTICRLCSDECRKLRNKNKSKIWKKSERGKESRRIWYYKKINNMSEKEYIEYRKKRREYSKTHNKKYSELTEEEKQKRRKYQKQIYEQINNNFKAKPIEERIKIGENKIKELLEKPIEELLKSNMAKAKISKIIGLTSEKIFQKQKVYKYNIICNVNYGKSK
jgi:hypothetical protein